MKNASLYEIYDATIKNGASDAVQKAFLFLASTTWPSGPCRTLFAISHGDSKHSNDLSLIKTLPLDAADIAKASRQTQEIPGTRKKAFAVKRKNLIGILMMRKTRELRVMSIAILLLENALFGFVKGQMCLPLLRLSVVFRPEEPQDRSGRLPSPCMRTETR
jgi:hypothetical protein